MLDPRPPTHDPTAMLTTLRLHLPSIHAIRAIRTALQGVEGIVHAEVSRTGATIEHDGRATADRLREAVASSGFEVIGIVEERRRLTVKHEGAGGAGSAEGAEE